MAGKCPLSLHCVAEPMSTSNYQIMLFSVEFVSGYMKIDDFQAGHIILVPFTFRAQHQGNWSKCK